MLLCFEFEFIALTVFCVEFDLVIEFNDSMFLLPSFELELFATISASICFVIVRCFFHGLSACAGFVPLFLPFDLCVVCLAAVAAGYD